jgi:hypothetical protein
MLALAFVAFGLALRVDSDGARRVAIQRTPTTLEVRDEGRGTRAVLGLAPGCGLQSLSRGGVVLLRCRDAYQTIDLRTGERDTYAPPIPEFPPDEQVDYVGAGRYWLARAYDDYHYEDLDYVQRFTGEVRRADGLQIYGDVDAPGLVKPLCSPLHRFGYGYPHNGAAWQPATSDGHVAVIERYGDDVWRCGDRRAVASAIQGVTAGGGWATWERGALRLRDVRRFRLPRGHPVHTRRAVYLLRGTRLRRAPLPAS